MEKFDSNNNTRYHEVESDNSSIIIDNSNVEMLADIKKGLGLINKEESPQENNLNEEDEEDEDEEDEEDNLEIVLKSKKSSSIANISIKRCSNVIPEDNNDEDVDNKLEEEEEEPIATPKSKVQSKANSLDASIVPPSVMRANLGRSQIRTNKSLNKSHLALMNDEALRELALRELERKRASQRRQSKFIKREYPNRRENGINPVTVAAVLKSVDKSTPSGDNKLYLKYLDCVLALTVCVNISLSIIDNEIYMTYSDFFIQNYTTTFNITNMNTTVMEYITQRELTAEENTLRALNVLVVIANLVFIALNYHLKIKLLRMDRKLSEYDNIFTSGLYKFLFLELFICAFLCPPYINYVMSGEMMNYIYTYNLNSIISFVVMLKCYIIIRVYSYFSRWTSDAANSVCMKVKIRPGIHFAVKAELKKRPYTMLTILMLIALFFGAFAVRTFEYGGKNPENTTSVRLKGDNGLQSLINCFWLIIVTMTTVGYGDLTPKSHFGRLVIIFACIVGMLLVSLIVVSLAVIAEFTNEEKKAYSIIKKIQADEKAYNKAADVIKDVLKLRVLVVKRNTGAKFQNTFKQWKNNSNLTSIFIVLAKLKRTISIFKTNFKVANSYSLPIDEMLKRLEGQLKKDINSLTENIKKVSLVDNHIIALSSMQELVHEKMSLVLERQHRVANYIVKLNNQYYRDILKKNFTDTKLPQPQKKAEFSDKNAPNRNSNISNLNIMSKNSYEEEREIDKHYESVY